MGLKVRDPVHNFISLNDAEAKLLDTSVIQRLRKIRQLAMANLVYPGAVHTRFDHSLGAMHVAGLMAGALRLNDDETHLVRIASLLHDVGHGPFSHVSEHLLEKYADRSKLAPDQKKEKIHELISAAIISTDQQIRREIGKSYCEKVVKLLGEGHGQPALRSIVSGPLDADKQDYLLRDSLFCGVPYGMFDMHQLHRSLALQGPEHEKELMIKRDVIHSVEQYVLAKYYLTTNVYRHKVRLITDHMLVRAIELGIEKDEIKELKDLYCFDNSDGFVANYKSWDDERFMNKFCVEADGTKSKGLLQRLLHRQLLKRVFYEPANDFSDEVKDMLLSLSKPHRAELRIRIESAISQQITRELKQAMDSDYVIVNVFDIRSVKEMSKNDEGGILVAGRDPRPFIEESTLFASIDASYADEFVEVYAPVRWDTYADKLRLRRKVFDPIKEVIEVECSRQMKIKADQPEGDTE